MFFAVQVWVWARSILNALLGCLTARPAAAILVTPKVDLFVNDYIPQVSDTMSAYTLASFPGYVDATPTFSPAANTGPNTSALVASVTFEMTATGTVTGTCYGCVLSDGAGNFQGASRFEEPALFSAPGDTLFLDVALPAQFSVEVNG